MKRKNRALKLTEYGSKKGNISEVWLCVSSAKLICLLTKQNSVANGTIKSQVKAPREIKVLKKGKQALFFNRKPVDTLLQG